MITPEELVGEEWAAWYRLTPQERWRESEKLWQVYFYLGGSLDTQPDTQSPFFDPKPSSSGVTHGRPGMRIFTAQPSLAVTPISPYSQARRTLRGSGNR
jgi:hypothetical protein